MYEGEGYGDRVTQLYRYMTAASNPTSRASVPVPALLMATTRVQCSPPHPGNRCKRNKYPLPAPTSIAITSLFVSLIEAGAFVAIQRTRGIGRGYRWRVGRRISWRRSGGRTSGSSPHSCHFVSLLKQDERYLHCCPRKTDPDIGVIVL